MRSASDARRTLIDAIATSRVARLAAYTATAASATSAGATIYSQVGLSLDVGFVGSSSNAVSSSVTIRGTGGATVLTLNGGANYAAVGGSNFRRSAAITGAGVVFRTLSQSASVGNINGGLPVGYGATWSASGRHSTEFVDWRAFGSGVQGGLNLSTSNWSDFQQVAGGQTWYLLFRFTHSSTTMYGWLSLTATVDGFGAMSDNYITITGWGWDDSGSVLGAGVTATAIPGGGALAALATGASGLRLRRRHPRV